MRSSLIASAILADAVAVGFGLYFGGSIEESVQVELWKNLITSSAIIFGVVGAWIAIIYPRTLDHARDLNSPNPLREVDVYRSLRPAMVSSTIVLGLAIVAAPVSATVYASPGYLHHADICRRLSFAILSGLTIVELLALILSLVPLVITESDLSIEAKRTKQMKSQLDGVDISSEASAHTDDWKRG